MALGRLEQSPDRSVADRDRQGAPGLQIARNRPKPLFALAIDVENRNDKGKTHRRLGEAGGGGSSLSFENNASSMSCCCTARGGSSADRVRPAEEPLQPAGETTAARRSATKETIKGKTTHIPASKRQSAATVQFGDVHIEVWPLERRQEFVTSMTRLAGRRRARQFIGSVEDSAREYLARRPLELQWSISP